MITLIEALNFRCLHYIRQPLDHFHILVGPNASGKTTFLDVVAFLGDLVSDGIEYAIRKRTQNVQDLIWERSLGTFELAIEARIPDHLRERVSTSEWDTIRYEISIGIDPKTQETGILAEKALLTTSQPFILNKRSLFPATGDIPSTILTPRAMRGSRSVLTKVLDGNDTFFSETATESEQGWLPAFKFGPRRSTLANLPADETMFPVSTWLKDFLVDGVQHIVLNSLFIRNASPEQVLCFAKTPEGATDIVAGNNHPILQNWHRETNLSTLFAAGVFA